MREIDTQEAEHAAREQKVAAPRAGRREWIRLAVVPGPTWDRLAAIKERYDPTNLFRLNQNISPAIEGRDG